MVGLKCVRRTREPFREALRAHQRPYHRLTFMTWGDLNSIPYFVELQRSAAWAVDAVICDNVGDVMRRRGKARSLFSPADHIDASKVQPIPSPKVSLLLLSDDA